MTVMRRSTFLQGSAAGGTAAVFASIAIPRAPARAADFAFKYASPLPIEHPVNQNVVKMWNAVREESGGKLVVEQFPNNQLGGDTATLTQLRSNAVQFLHFTGGVLASVVPWAAMDGIGFAFKTRLDALAAIDGALGDYIRDQMTSRGIYGFEKIWENGYRQITSSTRPIRTPDDLAGFKIRTPASSLWLDLFRTLGASPTPMNFSDVYTALQTHVIDGQENPYGLIETSRVYEVQKYLSETNHIWSGYWFIANLDAWKSLPPALQAIVNRNATKYALLERAEVARFNENVAAKLKTQGLAFNVADPAPFKAKLGPFYAKQKAAFGEKAWSLLEKTTGPLAG